MLATDDNGKVLFRFFGLGLGVGGECWLLEEKASLRLLYNNAPPGEGLAGIGDQDRIGETGGSCQSSISEDIQRSMQLQKEKDIPSSPNSKCDRKVSPIFNDAREGTMVGSSLSESIKSKSKSLSLLLRYIVRKRSSN